MKASSEVAVHVEELRSQLTSALSEFAEFREKTEADTLQQNQKYAESIAVVEQKLASIDRRIENLSNAINLQALELDEVSSELRSGHS